ncbi:hypothetical protein [Microbacterium sp. CFBP9034]|uniref:hypothetical protein n=1 Tax=Microbacterium sp. CFBP9034 TaxID=3096540 RepID=UPI002A6A398C|nr:hypothetical protein [Microbacterium sp. CFBP9034]MDY0909444.1 hypothetical protein [Microbacterium sp. CFBP9034]
MDAPPLSPDPSRELADLRRRAYGPDADIQRDPEAQARLRELEDLARTREDEPVSAAPAARPRVAAAPPPIAAGEASAAPEGAARSDDDPSPAGGAASATDSFAPLGAGRPWWRRIPTWTIAAGVGVVGLVAGIGIGAAFPLNAAQGPDRTLDVSPGAGVRGDGFVENLNYWGVDPGTVVPHEPFERIDVWTARASDDSRCVLVSYRGDLLSATCASGALDPVLDFTVYDGLPFELEEPLTEGSVIRFIGRPGSVEVWLSTAGSQPESLGPTTSRTDSLPRAA